MPTPDNLRVEVLDAEIFGGCNYKCHFCPQSQGREKDFIRRLPMETFEKMVDDAMQYGLKTVTLHGSGEPTLNKEFPDYVRAVKERGLTCISFTNGFRLFPKLSESLVDAGIDILRISCIGYDEPTYEKSMKGGIFEQVRDNVAAFAEISAGSESQIHFNHLIIDNDQIEFEVREYKKTWHDHCAERGGKVAAEIWKMHNWAGSDKIEIGYERETRVKRSCGRPNAPLLQVRAGGTGGHRGTVVACCMVLGQDSKAELGYLDTQSIAEVVSGDKYTELRAAHDEKRFDDIDYCKNCDQLYETPEALVWSNIPGREYQQSKNLPSLNFSDYA